MIRISTQNHFASEKKYLFEYLFKERLGLEYTIDFVDFSQNYFIEVCGKKIIIYDDFFKNILDEKNYIDKLKIPLSCELLTIEKFSNFEIPIFYGESSIAFEDGLIEFNADVFGAIFFYLTRWEEIVVSKKDNHQRFKVTDSFSFKHKLLERPVVDEYVELMRLFFKYFGITKFNQNYFNIKVSCDVDWPFDPTFKNNYRFLRTVFFDLVKRKNLKLALDRTKTYRKIKEFGWEHDPFNNFNFLMKTCEENGLKNAFYFISGQSAGILDGEYSLLDPRIRNLLKEINHRGHEIGIHFSYNSYKDIEIMTRELQNLKGTLSDIGINKAIEGGRQHYLRWETPTTPILWNELGLLYDSTLGFAEHIGFRAGTSHEFYFFDLLNRKRLNLKEKPLIVMDCTVINYMGLGYSEYSLQRILSLKEVVKKYNGCFTFLWHNSFFKNKEDYYFFKTVIES